MLKFFLWPPPFFHFPACLWNNEDLRVSHWTRQRGKDSSNGGETVRISLGLRSIIEQRFLISLNLYMKEKLSSSFFYVSFANLSWCACVYIYTDTLTLIAFPPFSYTKKAYYIHSSASCFLHLKYTLEISFLYIFSFLLSLDLFCCLDVSKHSLFTII